MFKTKYTPNDQYNLWFKRNVYIGSFGNPSICTTLTDIKDSKSNNSDIYKVIMY